jgi:hypothetical protein
MHGNFNGVRLKRIVTVKTTGMTTGVTRNTLRVLPEPMPMPELEKVLRLNGPGLLILSNKESEGTIVHYTADLHGGFYQVTIESKE